MKKYIKIARPDHWVKNAFILPGVVIAVLMTKPVFSTEYIWKFILGFFSTCFMHVLPILLFHRLQFH